MDTTIIYNSVCRITFYADIHTRFVPEILHWPILQKQVFFAHAQLIPQDDVDVHDKYTGGVIFNRHH